MKVRWSLLLLAACTIPAGDPHQIVGVVREAGGSTLVIEHDGVTGALDAASTRFLVDPNLARQVSAGDRVTANVLIPPSGGDIRVIGIEKLPQPPQPP